MRQSAERALAATTSSTGPVDHSAWILDGLWPPDLQPVTAETAVVAEQLDQGLRGIVGGANERMWELKRANPGGGGFGVEELRVLNVARARAVLLVEQVVRQLRREPPL